MYLVRKGGDYMKNKLKKALPFMLAASLALAAAPGVGAVVSDTAEAASINIKKEDGTFFYIPGGETNTINYSIGGKGSTEGYPCHQSNEKDDNQIVTGAYSDTFYTYVTDPYGQITNKIIPSVNRYGEKYNISFSVSNLNTDPISVKGELPFCKYENCSSIKHELAERHKYSFGFTLQGVRCQVSPTYDLVIRDTNNNFTATYDVAGNFPNMELVGTATGANPADLGISWNFSGNNKLILSGGSGNFKPDTTYSFRFVSTTNAGNPISVASNTFTLRVSKKQVGNLSKTDFIPAGESVSVIDLPKLPRGVDLSKYTTKTITGASGTIEQNGMYPRLRLGSAQSFADGSNIKIEFKDSLSCSDFEMNVNISNRKLDAGRLASRNTFYATGTINNDNTLASINSGTLTSYGLLNADVIESGDKSKISSTYNASDFSPQFLSGITGGGSYKVTWTVPSLSTLGNKYNVPSTGTTMTGTLNVYNTPNPSGFTVISDYKGETITVYPESSVVPKNLYYEVMSNDGSPVKYTWYLDGAAVGSGSTIANGSHWGVSRGTSTYLNIEDLGAFVRDGSETDDHTIYCRASSSSGQTIDSGVLKFGIRYIKSTGGGISWDNAAGISGGGGGSSSPAVLVPSQKTDTAETTSAPKENTAEQIKSYQTQYSHAAAGTPSKMNRLLNIASGEHLFSTDTTEVAHLLKNGWKNENIGGKSVGEKTGDPVYRVFNSATMEHLYTMSLKEKNYLVSVQKWNDEGIVFFSGGKTTMTRLYNPKAAAFSSHLLTSDENEIRTLMSRGWINEGKTWSIDQE